MYSTTETFVVWLGLYWINIIIIITIIIIIITISKQKAKRENLAGKDTKYYLAVKTNGMDNDCQ